MKTTYKVVKCYRVDIYNEKGVRIRHKWYSTKEKAFAEGERLVKAYEEDSYYGRPFTGAASKRRQTNEDD